MNTLWQGTPLETFAGRMFACPTHRLAFFIGQIEQTVFDMFGVDSDSEDVPDEARQAALVMLNALKSGSNLGQAMSDVSAIVAAWRTRRVVN